MQQYTIYVGADHRGFEKKNQLIELLKNCHPGMVAVADLGAQKYDAEDDFNDPAIAVAQAVSEKPETSIGVLLCGSGQGVCMQANRLKGARAILAFQSDEAKAGREDDHANIVCLSADKLEASEMEKIVKAFCHARPKNEAKYLRRMQRLDNIEV